MPIRILKRKFNGGPLDGEERLLASTVCEWKEFDYKSDEENTTIHFHHLYKLGSDAEFHYKGEF